MDVRIMISNVFTDDSCNHVDININRIFDKLNICQYYSYKYCRYQSVYLKRLLMQIM